MGINTNAVRTLNNTGQGEQLPSSVPVEEKVYTKENPFIPPKGNEMIVSLLVKDIDNSSIEYCETRSVFSKI